ncbi:uncharacterized protein EHS24_005047 [Apiotrichum porosum]|uniref:Enoyl reductase (ER) domain-containing protein n=1 Tax=Apiotrichum porosum TaxID=105984 RepID=A0A427Y6R1_9TREE|nr:uncharacterized protein EHS24_005047 [Apiotrichum porosum]RSH86775.1 hypothetical protein EHS24_005047 [Apiotrichum porosum]
MTIAPALPIPATMRAMVQGDGDQAAIQEVPVPKLDEGDVLVKVDYASLNPTDWKHVAWLSPKGAVIGCDYTGTVVATTSHPRVHLKVGDRVAGWVHGGMYPDRGSYAEYLHIPADLCWKVPDNVTPQQAGAYGVPYCTAFHGLVHSQKGAWPPTKLNKWILIYGGSSSVGLYALQLAKLMGYKTITTCSPHNNDLVKSYGADEIVDYANPAAHLKIKEITGGGVDVAMDCISDAKTQAFCVDCFGDKGGQLNLTLQADPEVEKKRTDVKLVFTLLYTLFGKDISLAPRGQKNLIPAIPQERDFFAELCAKTPEYISVFGIRPPPLEERQGLDVITAAFEEMKAGKISGKRIVFKIGA